MTPLLFTGPKGRALVVQIGRVWCVGPLAFATVEAAKAYAARIVG